MSTQLIKPNYLTYLTNEVVIKEVLNCKHNVVIVLQGEQGFGEKVRIVV